MFGCVLLLGVLFEVVGDELGVVVDSVLVPVIGLVWVFGDGLTVLGVLDFEAEDIPIVYSVLYVVGMGGFTEEFSCDEFVFSRILRHYGCSCEACEGAFGEGASDVCEHIPECASVALVNDEYGGLVG